MKTKPYRSTFNKHPAVSLVAVVVGLLVFSNLVVSAQQEPAQTAAPAQETPDAPKIPNDQLDALVAPIALYPDPLLSQVLVASTYPLELVQLQQWLNSKGAYLNEKAVTEGVQKEDWDPSIQAMAALPTVVKQLAENIKWTSDLGNAFLAQQGDVMDAVQRMRTKAKDGGKLQSTSIPATTPGATTRNIAVALLTQIGTSQTGMAERLAGIPYQTGKRPHARILAGRLAPWTVAVLVVAAETSAGR